MLVALPNEALASRSPIAGIFADPGYAPQRLDLGVYLTHINFSHDIEEWVKSDYPYGFSWNHSRQTLGDEEYERALKEYDWVNEPHDYGVCDNWEQITERWPQILEDDRKIIISLAEFRREDQPERGGWRWHKWGEYIGTQDPQHEYLYDDTHIDVVYAWHLMELK